MTSQELITENARRQNRAPYDPLRGINSVSLPESPRLLVPSRNVYVPASMLADPEYRSDMDDLSFARLRCRHDFEYWCASCVRIRHKISGESVPFVLNAPQRRVFASIERQRVAGQPIRLIMLKARQWGGSTLVQMLMAWIQCVHRRNWNSLICAHVKDTSATIRGMFTKLIGSYPLSLWDDGSRTSQPQFRPFERSLNTRVIDDRDCKVTVCSIENQDAVRGLDVSMAHLSEVAFWADSTRRSPADFVRAVCSGIPLQPYTVIALESTANGVGNYFHSEWLRAQAGESDKIPVFVPWYEIDICSREVDDPLALWEKLGDYERALWYQGEVTLENLAWYWHKRREFSTHAQMKAEFPSTPLEAFVSTGYGVFDPECVDRLRRGCSVPAEVGEVSGDAPKGPKALRHVRFSPGSSGALSVWHHPVSSSRYVTVVDVGGRSPSSDFSVIAVFERRPGLKPRVAAQWRGHIDHDLLGWKAAAISRYYRNALLVVESNSLESEWDGNSLYILEEINRCYGNIYYRAVRDTNRLVRERRAGFHTNRETKTLVITSLISAVRDGDYEEADLEACNEFDSYELTPSGAYAAAPGRHDDILMTRAIGMYVISTLPPVPVDSVAEFLASYNW